MRQEPCERELRRRAPLARGDLFNPAHECEVLVKVLALKARVVAAPVVGRDVGRRSKPARQESTTERTIRDERNLELPAERQQLVFWISRPQRELGLQR